MCPISCVCVFVCGRLCVCTYYMFPSICPYEYGRSGYLKRHYRKDRGVGEKHCKRRLKNRVLTNDHKGREIFNRPRKPHTKKYSNNKKKQTHFLFLSFFKYRSTLTTGHLSGFSSPVRIIVPCFDRQSVKPIHDPTPIRSVRFLSMYPRTSNKTNPAYYHGTIILQVERSG